MISPADNKKCAYFGRIHSNHYIIVENRSFCKTLDDISTIFVLFRVDWQENPLYHVADYPFIITNNIKNGGGWSRRRDEALIFSCSYLSF